MSEGALQNRTVVVTRPEARAAELCSRLEELGAKTLPVPSIRFSRPEDIGSWHDALARRDDFTHVVFTSRVAADTFDALCAEADIRAASWLANLTIGAIGDSTGERLEEAGVPPTLVASGSTGKEFASELLALGLLGENSRVLLPGSDIARPELAEALRRSGASVTQVPIYRTIEEDPDRAEALFDALDRERQPHAVTFASPSALSGFLGICGDRGRALLESQSVKIVSLGPTTSEAIRSAGLVVSAQARKPSTEGLIEAIGEALGRQE